LFTGISLGALRTMENDEWERKLTNLSWMVVPVGIAVTLATFLFSVLTASPEEVSLDNYYIVVLLTGTLII